MIKLDFLVINRVSIGVIGNGLEFFSSVELRDSSIKSIKIYPFTIEGYVAIAQITNNEVRSISAFTDKATERLGKLNKTAFIENLNNQSWIEENDSILFNITTGEIIGSIKTNTNSSLIWKINPPSFKDASYDEYLINLNGRFWRTSHQFGTQLALKARIEKEIFSANKISEFLLGLFLEIEEYKLAEYVKIDEVLKILKPGRDDFEIYEKAFIKELNELV